MGPRVPSQAAWVRSRVAKRGARSSGRSRRAGTRKTRAPNLAASGAGRSFSAVAVASHRRSGPAVASRTSARAPAAAGPRESSPVTSRLPPASRRRMRASGPEGGRSAAGMRRKGPFGVRRVWRRRAARDLPVDRSPRKRAGAPRSAAAWRPCSRARMAGPRATQGSAGSGGGAPTRARRRSSRAAKMSRSKGLGRKSSAPRRMASTMSRGSPKALMSTTRRAGWSRLARWISSRPLKEGSRRSVTSTSKEPVSRARSPSRGSPKAATSQGESARACTSRRRKLSLSSTSRRRMDRSYQLPCRGPDPPGPVRKRRAWASAWASNRAAPATRASPASRAHAAKAVSSL